MPSTKLRKILEFISTMLVAQVLFADPLNACCRSTAPKPRGPIPLEQSQLNQIANAEEIGKLDALRANKTLTYQSQNPIVTEFTLEQRERILAVYGGFGRNQPIYDPVPWLDNPPEKNTPAEETPAPAPNSNPTTTASNNTQIRRRRSVGTQVQVCPVQNIMDNLILAWNTDDELLQIIQFNGFQQWVLRQECGTSISPHGQLSTGSTETNIACETLGRPVYLVAIRLDDAAITSGDIDVQEVWVESCSSFA